METFILTFLIIGAALCGLAVGVIFSNKRLKGSCGGLGRIMGEDCQYCEKQDQCIEEDKKPALSKSIS